MKFKAPVIYDPTGEPIELPYRIALCDACEGKGTTVRHVECDGGGFTASEWAEQDEDFREDYLSGVYDRPCPECKGAGRVAVADESRMSPELIQAYRDDARAEAELRAEEEAERRFGC